MDKERLLEDAVKIDDLLVAHGIIKNYVFSAGVVEASLENMEAVQHHMKNMSDDIVAMCLAAGTYSWRVFEPSNLPRRMGYYFQRNDKLPVFGKPARGPAAYAVICNETGQIYSSVRDLAERLDCSVPTVYRHLHGYLRVVKGHTFSKYDPGLPFIPSPPPTPKKRGVSGKEVREILTNERWPSAAALAADLGMSYIATHNHLAGRAHSLAGRVFEYVDDPRAPPPLSKEAQAERVRAMRIARDMGRPDIADAIDNDRF